MGGSQSWPPFPSLHMAAVEAVLLDFFQYLFGKDQGYVCIATTRPPAKKDTFNEQFFEWPAEKDKMVDFIEKATPGHNVYFGVNVLSVPRRIKENCIPQNLLWADLDTCPPDKLEIPPQCVIESSPQHFQGIWRLNKKIDPRVAEDYSKRIAYHHSELGVDKTGHDLTQLLRVPGTYNFKYQLDEAPQVILLQDNDTILYDTEPFETLPKPSGYVDVPDLAVPDLDKLPSPEEIIQRYEEHLRPTAFARYYSEEPSFDWSKHLWRLINLCLDSGMSADETFVIAHHSKCNKYERDGRPISHLWREVLKAELERKNIEVLLEDHRVLAMPSLITSAEQDSLGTTIVDDYMAWATSATDAVPAYHELSCCVLLSALMSTTLRLEMRHSKLVPNLWGLVLGDSTLTRKTTAMNMAMDFVHEIDPDLIVSSDGSPEGLMHNLSLRPKMVSIFYRDEVSGFFSTIKNQQYARSMPEYMTQFYDVPKYMARTLRKETFVVSEPIFIFFGGGIPERVYNLVDEEYFISGFIPRFMVVEGRADIETYQATGPPLDRGLDKRFSLLQTFQAFHSMYTDQQVLIDVGGQKTPMTPEISVLVPSEIWERAAQMEKTLMQAGNDASEADMALPAFSRLYFSMMKLMMLLAAARQEPTDYKIVAEMRDLLNAAWYAQKWGKHMVEFIRNAGTTGNESVLRAVYRTIVRHPGILRGHIMRRHRLDAREMTLVEETLKQRLQIQVQPRGKRGHEYWPIGR